MSQTIFGHTWEEIDAAQRGGKLNRPIAVHTPNPTATQTDLDLLAQQGHEGLERKQFYGVIDRLKTSGLV